MKVEVCCLNQPLEDKIPMKSSSAYLDEMLSQSTRSGTIEVLFKWLQERGEISNLSDKQKERLPSFKEKMGIG